MTRSGRLLLCYRCFCFLGTECPPTESRWVRRLLYYLIFKASCTFYSILRYYRRALLTVQVPARLRVRPPLSGAEGYSTVIYSHVSGHVPTPIKLCLDMSNSLIFTQNRCFYITVRELLISADHILLVPFLWESDCVLP